MNHYCLKCGRGLSQKEKQRCRVYCYSYFRKIIEKIEEEVLCQDEWTSTSVPLHPPSE